MNKTNTKILIVDDERNICELIRLYVEKEGFDTSIAYDGAEAIEKFRIEKPDLCLLDIMLPKKDGWQVCREIRSLSNIPVIMLTAKGELFDKVLGLELGADDYIVKPFEPKELIARIKAVLRRSIYSREPETATKKGGEICYKGISINRDTYEVYLNQEKIELPPKEFELLYFLARNVNRVFTRDQLLNEIWGYEFYGDSRTVDVHIKRIRGKLEKGEVTRPWQIKTVWGVGYKFELLPED